MDFGAFVRIAPGKEGLVHISALRHERVNKVEDVVKIGDNVRVKLMKIDNLGRLDFSIKVLLEKKVMNWTTCARTPVAIISSTRATMCSPGVA